MDETIRAKDEAEAVALFRAQVLGPLLCAGTLPRGELAHALRALSETPVRPPGSPVTRTYAVPTLQRWYYAYRRGGLPALTPQRRSDRGHARALSDAQRELVLAIAREHPGVSAALLLRTLEEDGRLPRGLVGAATLRRLLVAHGLDRRTLRRRTERPRRRWVAPAPNAVWHADVCHGPALRVDGAAVPLRIHALLDDHSRYVVALAAFATEQESEMLTLFVRALRRHGAPDVLYLDNGPTYVGETLKVACGRLGIGLVHAQPHDPEARGKMERFWRTLRAQCLDHLRQPGSLHDVQAALLAWLDRHYLVTPHSSLLGKTPAQVYLPVETTPVPDAHLHEALLVRQRRRVRKDGTLAVAGTDFELDATYLCGRLVTVARSLLDPSAPPWIEHEDQRLALRPVDPGANGRRTKRRKASARIDAVPFDPNGARLAALLRGEGGAS